MSKYVTFTGISAAPEPPEPPACPECMGRCCRNDLGYPLAHLNWDVGEHWCEACFDGTVPVPVWTAEQERAAVVAWLRQEDYPCCRDCNGQLADWIERGDHRREEEP